eukprot:gene8705-17988_t
MVLLRFLFESVRINFLYTPEDFWIAVLHSFSAGVNLDWKAAVQNAAGVYKTPRNNTEIKNTVLITATNYGYLNHFHNFKCFMDRLHLRFLLIALDEKTFRYSKSIPDIVSISLTNNSDVDDQAHEYRSRIFNIISRRKMEAVYEVLNMGYNVIFLDIDVILLQNPVKIFSWDNIDYIFSLNKPCAERERWDFRKSWEEGNTGFYFARSNQKVLKVWQEYFKTAAADVTLEIDDQSLFWTALRACQEPVIVPLRKCQHQKYTPDQFLTCRPDTCETGAGAVVTPQDYQTILRIARKKRMSIISIHANYMVGNQNKKTRLDNHGLWLATIGNDGVSWNGDCKPFNSTLVYGGEKYY